MKENILKQKSKIFALEIIKTYKFLISTHKEFILSKQLLRSGTSIGAMIRESEFAESKPDFIHKLSIAQKEVNECTYWLELLYESQYIPQAIFVLLQFNAIELIKLITASIKTAKLSLKH